MKTYAPAGKRFIAFLIDWYLSSLIGSIPVIIIQSIQGKDLLILNQLEGLSLPLAWTACILAMCFHFLYYCYFPSKSGKNGLTGQTPGMRAMHLQILSVDGSEAALAALSVRYMLLFIVLQGYLTSSSIYLTSLLQMSTDWYIIPYIQSFYYITVIISLSIYLLSRKKQFLHDILTNTKVYSCK